MPHCGPSRCVRPSARALLDLLGETITVLDIIGGMLVLTDTHAHARSGPAGLVWNRRGKTETAAQVSRSDCKIASQRAHAQPPAKTGGVYPRKPVRSSCRSPSGSTDIMARLRRRSDEALASSDVTTRPGRAHLGRHRGEGAARRYTVIMRASRSPSIRACTDAALHTRRTSPR